MKEPQNPSDPGRWLPDPQEPNLSASPPGEPDDTAGRRGVASRPMSARWEKSESPEPANEGVFQRIWLWVGGDPIFFVVIATGTLILVGAIAIIAYLTISPGPSPADRIQSASPLSPQQQAEKKRLYQREVDALFAKNKPFDFNFELSDTDGQPIALADFAGKIVVVDVWGTWCPPCRLEIPHLVALQQKFEEAGLVIVGLNDERTADRRRALKLVQDFRRKNSMNYRCALVDEATLRQIPAFRSYPTTIFLDRQGQARALVTGYQDYDKLEIIVQKLLDENYDASQ